MAEVMTEQRTVVKSPRKQSGLLKFGFVKETTLQGCHLAQHTLQEGEQWQQPAKVVDIPACHVMSFSAHGLVVRYSLLSDIGG